MTPRRPNPANLMKVHSQGQSAMERHFGSGLDSPRMLSFSADSTLVCAALKRTLLMRRSSLVTIVINDFVLLVSQKIAYDWKSLRANSLVVDVGGGVGTACLAVAKEFPSLKFVIQDRQPVVEAGIEVHILS